MGRLQLSDPSRQASPAAPPGQRGMKASPAQGFSRRKPRPQICRKPHSREDSPLHLGSSPGHQRSDKIGPLLLGTYSSEGWQEPGRSCWPWNLALISGWAPGLGCPLGPCWEPPGWLSDPILLVPDQRNVAAFAGTFVPGSPGVLMSPLRAFSFST